MQMVARISWLRNSPFVSWFPFSLSVRDIFHSIHYKFLLIVFIASRSVIKWVFFHIFQCFDIWILNTNTSTHIRTAPHTQKHTRVQYYLAIPLSVFQSLSLCLSTFSLPVSPLFLSLPNISFPLSPHSFSCAILLYIYFLKFSIPCKQYIVNISFIAEKKLNEKKKTGKLKSHHIWIFNKLFLHLFF